MTPGRHALVRVAPGDWDRVLATGPACCLRPEARATLAAWARRGWPAIVRRRLAEDPPGALPLGVPLPPAMGRPRCALALPAGLAWETVPPPRLDALRGAAPAPWHRALDAALALGRATGTEPRAFGSLLWQALTGLPYLGAGSDLDLLWRVTAATDLDGLLAGLARIDAEGPARLDGEVLLPDGAGVNWRELLEARRRPGGEVLAKTAAGPSLRPAASPWREAPSAAAGAPGPSARLDSRP